MASLGRACSLVALAPMLSACLVTDEIQFPEDVSYPPTIVDVPGAEIIGAIVWIDLEGHPQNEWSFPIRIRDDNVDQTLDARYRVVPGGETLPLWTQDEIAPSGSPVREDYEVKVRFGDLKPGKCHRVELAVSGTFVKRSRPSPGLFHVTTDEDDLALVSWTIWEGTGASATTGEKALLIDNCEAIDTFLEAAQ